MLALLVLLTLGLGEPLLCILHCQVWLPAAYSHYYAAQHQHMHHHMAGMAMNMNMPMDRSMSMGMPIDMSTGDAPAAEPVSAPAPAHPQAENCFMQRGGLPVPFHVPPSPIHDLLPVLALVILVIQRLYRQLAAPPGDPRSPAVGTLLRPPILRTI